MGNDYLLTISIWKYLRVTNKSYSEIKSTNVP